MAPAPAATCAEGWRTYRSDQFGYALSFAGQSGTLVETATGRRLVELAVWPPGLCPPQPPGTAARQLGMERAAAITQADGPGGESSCKDPRILREGVSSGGTRHWELELRCSGGGTKGPTFFADVSQPWRSRVLMLDPIGIDPRQSPSEPPGTTDAIRRILDTLETFPLTRPPGVCIEELH
jgi:hypothetical protein